MNDIEALQSHIDRLEAENDKLSRRVGELTGHLNWIGWSSEGVAKTKAELAKLQAESSALKGFIAEFIQAATAKDADRMQVLTCEWAKQNGAWGPTKSAAERGERTWFERDMI